MDRSRRNLATEYSPDKYLLATPNVDPPTPTPHGTKSYAPSMRGDENAPSMCRPTANMKAAPEKRMLEKLQKENHDMKQKMDDMTREMQESKIRHAQELKARMREDNIEQKRIEMELKEDLIKCRAEIKKANEDSKNFGEKARKTIHDWAVALDKKKVEVEDLRLHLSDTSAMLETERTLRASATEETVRAHSLHDDIKAMYERVSRDGEMIRAEAMGQAHDVTTLRRELEGMHTAHTTLLGERDCLQREKFILDGRANALDGDLAKAKVSALESQRVLEGLRQRAEGLERDSAEKTALISQLDIKVMSVQAEANAAIRERNLLRADATTLKLKDDSLLHRYSMLQGENSSKVAALEEASRFRSDLEEKIASLEIDMGVLRGVVSATKDELEATKRDRKSTQDSLHRTARELQESMQHSEQQGGTIKRIGADLASTRTTLLDERAQAQDTAQEHMVVRRDLEGQLAASANDVTQLTRAAEATQREMGMLRGDVSRTHRDLQALTMQHEVAVEDAKRHADATGHALSLEKERVAGFEREIAEHRATSATQLSACRQEVSGVRAELAKTTQFLAAAETATEVERSALTAANVELATARVDFSQMTISNTRAMEEKTRQIAELHAKVASLCSDLDTERQRCSAEVHSNTTLSAASRQQSVNVEILREKLAEKDAKADQHLLEICTTKHDLECAEAALAQLQASHNALVAASAVTTSELSTAQSQLVNKMEEITNLTLQLQDFAARHDAFITSTAVATEEVLTLKRKLEETRRAKDVFETELRGVNAELDRATEEGMQTKCVLRAKGDALTAEMVKVEELTAELSDAREARTKDGVRASEASATHKAAMESLYSTLRECEKSLEGVSAEKCRLEQRCEDLDAIVDEKEEAMNEGQGILAQQVAEAKGVAAERGGKLSQANAALEATRAELASKTTCYLRLEKDMRAADIEAESQRARVLRLEVALEEASNSIAIDRRNTLASEASTNHLLERMNAMKAQTAALQGERTTQADLVAELRQQIADITGERDMAVKECGDKDTKMVPSERYEHARAKFDTLKGSYEELVSKYKQEKHAFHETKANYDAAIAEHIANTARSEHKYATLRDRVNEKGTRATVVEEAKGYIAEQREMLTEAHDEVNMLRAALTALSENMANGPQPKGEKVNFGRTALSEMKPKPKREKSADKQSSEREASTESAKVRKMEK